MLHDCDVHYLNQATRPFIQLLQTLQVFTAPVTDLARVKWPIHDGGSKLKTFQFNSCRQSDIFSLMD